MTASLEEVMRELAGTHCTNYTGPDAYNCFHNGRIAFSEYTADAACTECIANAALNGELHRTWSHRG